MLASPSVKKKDARSALEIHGELLPGLFALSDAVLQKGSVVTGVLPLEITTSVEQWAYAVLFPLRAEAARETANRFFLVTVEAEVMSGRIGIGYIARDGSTYLATEIERVAEAEDSSINLFLGPREVDEGGWLVVRNTAGDGRPSKVMLRSIRTFQTNATRIPDFTEVDPPALPCKLAQPGREISCEGGKDPGRNRRARKFRVLVTHTSRSWDWKRCSRDFLRQRVSDPKRLSGLPAFELLPGYQGRLYSGGMTLLDVDVDENEVRGAAQRCVDSRFKIQHATVIGQRLVVCFEDFLAAFPEPDVPLSDIDLSPGSPWRVDDNWFGGLHTVFPVDSDVCMVSSSGADAVLWVDLRLRKVVRRWRLPQEIYGFNYGLTPEMSVVDHYIHNDIQLGHLNCAYPDGNGGCYISTLFQGDIAHLAADGHYRLLARGYIGCHGVRIAQNGRDLYFSDSCGGRLMQLGEDASVRELWNTESRWLHDAVQLEDDLYLLCLGDTNEIAIVDTDARREVGRFGLESRGVNVQFASIIG